jgi:hypothetical protein
MNSALKTETAQLLHVFQREAQTATNHLIDENVQCLDTGSDCYN